MSGIALDVGDDAAGILGGDLDAFADLFEVPAAGLVAVKGALALRDVTDCIRSASAHGSHVIVYAVAEFGGDSLDALDGVGAAPAALRTAGEHAADGGGANP